MKIALISCVKKKRQGTYAARDLYISTLFKLAFAYAGKHADRAYILSAKYGLVAPSTPIRNYDVTLNRMFRAEQRRWAEDVAAEIKRAVSKEDTLVFLCGEMYRRDLLEHLSGVYRCEVPIKGLQLGRQLQWYKRNI